MSSTFVGLENYQILAESRDYIDSVIFTVIFAFVVSFLSLALALLLAVKADSVIHGQGPYKVTLYLGVCRCAGRRGHYGGLLV